MQVRLPLCFLFLLIVVAAITLACGSSSSMTRGAQSLTVAPATADASQYPNGQVPFLATAYYNSPPSPVQGVSATWGACYQNVPTTDVVVNSSGVARCAAAASGTYTVWAYVVNGDQACPAFETACGGGGCQVTGTAQLTCP